ncbi:MAG: MFS transporter [Deltaproteobacteria bacterium]|uniref:MFS transporter n=1 Tax=Candidatus Zymogenus saltonus TaxID=2844893 RepID=A0A9D8PNR9_9DELT|nr:MFS transporter [Candidatus Zymogenus saltonus]
MEQGAKRDVVPVGVKLGYGAGDFAMSMAFNLPAFYMMYYFTDVFGVAAAAAGMIMFSSKIWDSLVSPAMGYISDHTRSRWGSKRPYILFGAVPAGVSIALLFATPNIASEGLQIAYGLAMFFLFCTAMTMMVVPYGALTANMTSDSRERTVISAYRMAFAVVGTLVGAGATIPLVKRFGGALFERFYGFADVASEKAEILVNVLGFRSVGILYGVVLASIVLVSFFSVRERPNAETNLGDNLTFKDNVRLILKNRPFLILTCGVLMHQTSINIMSGVMVYFFKYNLGNELMVPVAFMIILGVGVLMLPVYIYISHRKGKKFAYNMGTGIMASMSIPIFLFGDISIGLTMLLLVLVGFGISTAFLSPWSIIPDTVEYSEWKTGIRREGIHYGFFQFAFKLSGAISGLVIGVVLRFSGYIANQPQTPGALLGIKTLLTLIPMVLCIVGITLISRFPIDAEMHERMVADIKKRGQK